MNSFSGKEDYDMLTEDFVAEIMSDLTTEPFNSIVSDVKELFIDRTNYLTAHS